jgi:hypothetical protein
MVKLQPTIIVRKGIKSHIKNTLTSAKLGRNYFFWGKRGHKRILKAPKMILKDTKGTQYIEDVGGTVVENVLY